MSEIAEPTEKAVLMLMFMYEYSPREKPSELIGATSGELGYFARVAFASGAALSFIHFISSVMRADLVV